MGIYNSHGSPNGSPKKNCGRPSVSDYSQWMFVSWIVSLIISLPLFLFRILHVYTCMNICLSNLLLFWSCWGNGNGTPLQYSCLENPMDGRAWKAAVHGVAEGWTWLSNFTFTFHFHALEKEMATHSSVLAWRIPETGEPGGLPSMGSHRVGHDWSDLAAAAGGMGKGEISV